MKITHLGHGGFHFATQNGNVIIDPFVENNDLAQHIDLADYPADFLLLTRGHGDHVSDTEKVRTLNPTLKLVANYEVATYFQGKGWGNVHAMNHGGAFQFDFGRLKMVNAVHSSMLPDGSNGGNAVGLILEMEGKRIYFSGDTALTMDMKLIGDYDRPDLSILCIGDNFTMGIRDAVICSEFVKCDRVIGMHYNTFPPITIDMNEAKSSFEKAGKTLELPEIGKMFEY